MKSIRLNEPGCFEFLDTEYPGKPPIGQALVRVEHVGLCGTDIHAFGGKQPFFEYPRILGHELGVVIEELGSERGPLEVGMHCSVEPYLSQPLGRAFARGKTNCSASTQCLGVHVDGGMRAFVHLPIEKLHPSRLDTESLALVETLCIGHHAVKRARLMGDESVAVVGMGPIGLGVATFARLSGCDVVCCDLSEERLAKAGELVSGVEILKFEKSAEATGVWERSGSALPEVVFDCTGNNRSMEASIGLADFGGCVVFVGITKCAISFPGPDFHKRELSLIGSRNAVAEDFRSVIGHLEARRIDVSPWITHRCAAERFPQELETWLMPDSGLLKGVIAF